MKVVKDTQDKINGIIADTSKGKIAIATACTILIIGLIIYLCVDNFCLTKIERSTIKDYNNKIVENMDILLEKDEKGKYIIYSIRYLNNLSNSNTVNGTEVVKNINETFELNYSKEDLLKIGVTPGMQMRGITYDEANNIYTYNNEQTRTDIAATPIKVYNIKKISKKSKKKFVVEYYVYTVENPYEILNYYNDYNSNNEEKVDTKDILDYLKGKGDISKVKALVNKDNIKKIGKIEKNVKVTYIMKNDKIVLSDKK